MTIELPDDIVTLVPRTAEMESVTKTEVIRRMFAMLKVAQQEEAKGNHLGIMNDDKVIARLIGV